MNEFLEQFVVESRDLVAQANEGVLRLEAVPRDPESIDGVFRAFHTLKGGAGIVDFHAMEQAVHAAEDALGEVRAGRGEITAALVENCLACLDQIGRWLETISRTGELPSDAEQQANALVRRFAAAEDATSAPDTAWLAELTSRYAGEPPSTAIRYQPSAGCFFAGEDPMERVATLPQLLHQELAPVAPWPSLSELDPYHCNLVFKALTGSTADSVRAHFLGHSGTLQIVALTAAPAAAAAPHPRLDLDARVTQVLQSQLALLAVERPVQFVARLTSAGNVAANALRSAGREADSVRVTQAVQAALQQRTSHPLQLALQALLLPAAPVAPVVAERVQHSSALPTTIRVGTERIDALVRLTGELTVAKNALGHATEQARGESPSLAATLRQSFDDFERLIGQLQGSVLALRVLPLGTVLQRFPRALREVSSALGKPVALKIAGDQTEADKAVVEMLFEPLMHTLRNAIDHGVEQPAVRVERGKPLVATIKIEARRDGDRVLIEVEDDGAGIDVARVRQVALDRGIAAPEALQAMTEGEVIDLIFAPGFSTAATVTELSGRGVGLDAVRNVIERVGGIVTIASRRGEGTTVRFSLPFSVMVTSVLTVEAGDQVFGIPLDALIETASVPTALIAGVGAARVLTHRERCVPFIDLATLLGRGIDTRHDTPHQMVALASVAGEVIALRVERIGERIDVILKPLEGFLASLHGVAGTTLLGDGRVLLVLDLRELLS